MVHAEFTGVTNLQQSVLDSLQMAADVRGVIRISRPHGSSVNKTASLLAKKAASKCALRTRQHFSIDYQLSALWIESIVRTVAFSL